MPRIPFVPSQGQLDTGAPAIGASPGAFAAPFRALEEAGQRTTSTALQVLQVQRALGAEQAKLDVDEKLAELKVLHAEDMARLQRLGLKGKDYAARAKEQFDSRRSGLEGQLLYPESVGLYRRRSMTLGAQFQVEAINTGVKMQHAEILSAATVQQEEDVNRAVYAEDPGERQRAYGEALRRPVELQRSLVLSPEAGAAMLKDTLRDIERGGVERDSRNPVTVDRVLELLDAGAYRHLRPQEQASLAQGIRTRIDAEEARALAQEKRVRDALDRSMKEQGEEAERRIVERLGRGDMDEATLADYSRLLSSEKQEHYRQAIRAQGVEGGPEHGPTVRRLQGDVNRTDVTPAQIAATSRDVEAAFARGQIGLARYAQWTAHLQSLSLRKSTEGRDLSQQYLGRRHQQTEQNMRAALRTTSAISLDFDATAEEVLSQAMEDLTRNSAYFGRGNEDPEDWWTRRKAFYISRVSERATTRVEQLRKQTRFPDVATLKANRGAFASEADFYDQVRLWNEIRDLEREMARLKTIGGAPARTTTPTPAGTPAAPANRLGR